MSIEQQARENELRCYDQLPKSLRRAIAEADFQFFPSRYYRHWRAGTPCAELVADVKLHNRLEVERRDAAKAKGEIPHD
jgi:uncharacterized protein DUF6525